MSELKPCPFCGGYAFVQKVKDQYTVHCYHKSNCYLVGSRAPRLNIQDVLIKEWNRRVSNEKTD